MEKHDCGVKAKVLAKAGEALFDVYEVMEQEPRRMTLQARNRLIASMVNHVTLYRSAGGHMVYKHHGAIHMALNAGFQGNPRHVSTYEDEHENGETAKISLRVHGSTFAKSVFERFELQNPERRVVPIVRCTEKTNSASTMSILRSQPRLSEASAD